MSYWWALVVGVVAGFVATLLWAAVAYPAYVRLTRWRRYRNLGGTYQSRWKLTEKVVPGTLSIRVAGNVLEVTSAMFGGDPASGGGGPMRGWIVMSDELPGSGRGHYEQTLADGELVWGFTEIQVRDDGSMLVHRTYAHPREHRAVVSGFVWSRV